MGVVENNCLAVLSKRDSLQLLLRTFLCFSYKHPSPSAIYIALRAKEIRWLPEMLPYRVVL